MINDVNKNDVFILYLHTNKLNSCALLIISSGDI